VELFAIVPLFIGVIVIVIGTIIFRVVQGVSVWSYNNGQPVLTSPARIVSKCTDVRSRHSSLHSDDSFHHDRTYTDYYVTFELDSGERREAAVEGREYGMLAEGDQGDFTYQGTRYKGFVRRI
jgi:hypothetical protein